MFLFSGPDFTLIISYTQCEHHPSFFYFNVSACTVRTMSMSNMPKYFTTLLCCCAVLFSVSLVVHELWKSFFFFKKEKKEKKLQGAIKYTNSSSFIRKFHLKLVLGFLPLLFLFVLGIGSGITQHSGHIKDVTPCGDWIQLSEHHSHFVCFSKLFSSCEIWWLL